MADHNQIPQDPHPENQSPQSNGAAQIENTPPAPPPSPRAPARKKRALNSPMARAITIVALSLFLIVAISAISQLFTSFEVRLASGAEGLEITLTPRIREEQRIQQPPPTPTPAPTPEAEYPPEEDPYLPVITFGDGTTMELHPRPEYDGTGESPRLSFQEIFQKCAPSVVVVETEFRGFFAGMGGSGAGSGVIMTEDGYIITSAHVIEDAHRIYVVLNDDSRHTAALVGSDVNTDIAVLKINAYGLPPAQFGDSAQLVVGEEVAAIGNPLGQRDTISNGIISALDREMRLDGVNMRLIQTTAAINPGNSGGALINLYGQVVGITNMKLAGHAVEGMGFAVPTEQIKPVVDSIIERGYVPGRPGIGIVIHMVTYGPEPGLFVQQVASGTDAETQGLMIGDRILALNGTEVQTLDEMRDLLWHLRAGDVITLTLLRDGQEMDKNIRLMDSNHINF